MHQIRVSRLSQDFSKVLGMQIKEKEKLYQACMFHDLGKCRISQEIINKPGKLTEEERTEIQKHSGYGWQIATEIDMPADVAQIILYHHENYDGSGYPHGLTGNRIPYHARILRILDCYDALISDRPYRAKISVIDALKTIEREGDYFDPQLLSCFKEFIISPSKRLTGAIGGR